MRYLPLLFVACQSVAPSVSLPTEGLEADLDADETFESEPLRYADAPGHVVLRWVLSEATEDGGHHLMVIELPASKAEQATVLQRSLFDARFGPEEQETYEAKKAEFERVRDVMPQSALMKTPGPGFAELSAAGVWVSVRGWTAEDEADFGRWIDDEVGDDYFSGSGIQVDCADAALLLRWIYAHAHGLPVGNALGGSGRLFGNWTAAATWAKLPTHEDWRQDQRFLAAFRYLQANTYTHSLLGDLYPVQLDRTYVSPGAIHLTIRDVSGHTETIKHVAEPGDASCTHTGNCLQTIWGNEPPLETMYLSEMLEMHGNPKGRGGLMRHRWPEPSGGVWRLRRANQMPGYSEEQYGASVVALEGDAFQAFVYDKLSIDLAAADWARAAAAHFRFLLGQRRDLTALGYTMCGAQPCKAYDTYSTPSRDARIKAQAVTVQQRAAALSATEHDELLSSLRGRVLAGSPLTFADFAFDREGVLTAINSDPTVGYLARWGLTLGDDASLLAQAHAWQNAFFQRHDLVEQRRDTTAFDRGLRAWAESLRTLRTQVSEEGSANVLNLLDYAVSGSCPETCLVSDYLFGPLLDRMTARATDSYEKRMGF